MFSTIQNYHAYRKKGCPQIRGTLCAATPKQGASVHARPLECDRLLLSLGSLPAFPHAARRLPPAARAYLRTLIEPEPSAARHAVAAACRPAAPLASQNRRAEQQRRAGRVVIMPPAARTPARCPPPACRCAPLRALRLTAAASRQRRRRLPAVPHAQNCQQSWLCGSTCAAACAGLSGPSKEPYAAHLAWYGTPGVTALHASAARPRGQLLHRLQAPRPARSAA